MFQPRETRWRSLSQRPAIAWSTGLSGASKSSIANAVDRARAGAIPNFTGISAPLEAPLDPDLALATDGLSIAASAETLIAELMRLSAA